MPSLRMGDVGLLTAPPRGAKPCLVLRLSSCSYSWFSDNECGWSVVRMLFTEGQFIDGNPITFPPMRMDLKKLSDIVVVVEHIVALAGLPFLWLWWQKRDEKKPVAEPVSDFGRPLMKGN